MLRGKAAWCILGAVALMGGGPEVAGIEVRFAGGQSEGGSHSPHLLPSV